MKEAEVPRGGSATVYEPFERETGSSTADLKENLSGYDAARDAEEAREAGHHAHLPRVGHLARDGAPLRPQLSILNPQPSIHIHQPYNLNPKP